MPPRLRLATKLTLVFVLFAALIVTGLGAYGYFIGRQSLIEATLSDLQSTSLEKEAALTAWAESRRIDVERLANIIGGHGLTSSVYWPPALDPGIKAQILSDLFQWIGDEKDFASVMILHPKTGEVLISTDANEIGGFKENRPYFVNARAGGSLYGPYYSVTRQRPSMVAAAPVHAKDGTLAGVLAGRVRLSELNAIIGRRTGLRETDDSFLVNPAHLLVTQPRLVHDSVVLQRGIYTPNIDSCLAGTNTSTIGPDFRGVATIASYRWLADRELCLVVKVGQDEAFRSIRAFGWATIGGGALALFIAGLLSTWLARKITRPVLALQAGTTQVASGNLDVRLPEESDDELGQLARDFNEMTQALETRGKALRESERGLANAQRIAGLGAWEWNLVTNECPCSDEMYRIFGMQPQERVINYETFLGVLHPDEVEAVKDAVSQSLEGRKPYDIDYRIVRPNGEVRVVHSQAEVTIDDSGRPIGLRGTALDITDLKRAEAELKRLNEELEDRVEARTAELRAAQEELVRKERLAALGQLTGTVSHELRNPLGAKRTSIAVIKRLAGDGEPLLKSSVEIADRCVTRCDNIIGDLLEYSRVRDLATVTTVLDEWLDDLLDEYEPPAGVALRRELGSGAETEFDPERLRRVVMNLLDNACQAITQGEAGEGEVSVASRALNGRLEIAVADSGPGIAAADLERIFEPLYSTKSFGVGLGLPIVQGIMEQHGGGVEVASEAEGGAVFTLWLPLEKRSAAS